MPAATITEPLGLSDLDESAVGGPRRRAGLPARGLSGTGAQTIDEQADVDRALNEMVDLHGADDRNGPDPVQAAADGAAALRTVG